MELLIIVAASCALGLLAMHYGAAGRSRLRSREGEPAAAGMTRDRRSPAASLLDFGMRAARTGCGRIATVLRMLGARVVFETHPTDVVWPVLRDYPYGPSVR